jgi:shikimate kinase
MKTHLLLIGFSCTGKTYLGEQVFPAVIDSDNEVLKWVSSKENQRFDHIYEIFMGLGRDRALSLIGEAERALIERWADDPSRMVISLGPGFPLHENWARLRSIGNVLLLSKSPDSIYDYLKRRREKIFGSCPNAKEHDSWDVGVMVDAHRTEISRDEAISTIKKLLIERQSKYGDNEAEIYTNNETEALRQLTEWKNNLGL